MRSFYFYEPGRSNAAQSLLRRTLQRLELYSAKSAVSVFFQQTINSI